MNRFLYILLFATLSLWGCSTTEGNDNKLVKALNDTTMKMRGVVIEVTPGNYRFDYYDVEEKDSHYKYFDAKGYQGGGPTWKGIIYGAIKLSDVRLANNIRYDDEADGLAVWSNDREVLLKIARLVAVVKSDNIILEKCLKAAENDFDVE